MQIPYPSSGNPIRDEHHVVRYRKKDIWEMMGSDPPSVDPEIFESGSHPDKGISVNWLEYFGDNEQVSIRKVRKTMTYKNIKPTGGFLKLNVGDLRRVGREFYAADLSIIFSESPPPNISHADINPPGATTFNALALCAEHHGTVLPVP